MYEGCPVEFWMKQMILEDGEFDDRIHYCTVIRYDEERERVLLSLRGEKIDVVSLDGIYGCKIMDGEQYAICRGVVVERYLNKQGNMFVFQIENGFYKNNLN